MSDQITIRLDKPTRAKLEKLAEDSFNKPAGLIRYAIDQMIRTADGNGGTLLVREPKIPAAKSK